jgi:osmotically-inducible protein OsmY
VDIEEAINVSLRRFSPLQAVRSFFEVQSTNGNVKVHGNSGSLVAKRVLFEVIKRTIGVVDVDMNSFYDDESLLYEIGAIVPDGVLVNVHFGTVVLAGKFPDDHQELVRKVRSVGGVRTVVMSHNGSAMA